MTTTAFADAEATSELDDADDQPFHDDRSTADDDVSVSNDDAGWDK